MPDLHRYRVIASRNGSDISFLIVTASDEETALLDAFWELRDQFQISPHDANAEVRVELDDPPTLYH